MATLRLLYTLVYILENTPTDRHQDRTSFGCVGEPVRLGIGLRPNKITIEQTCTCNLSLGQITSLVPREFLAMYIPSGIWPLLDNFSTPLCTYSKIHPQTDIRTGFPSVVWANQ